MILLDPAAKPIVAHRGASGHYPENTLLAFRHGQLLGADAFELDVRLTADGIVVVFHDATVERTTDGQGAVRDLSAAELQEFDAGCGERVPRLVQVLEAFPEMPLIIELKEVEVAEPLRNILLRHRSAARCLVGAFERTPLQPFSRPEFSRSASRGETARFWLGTRVRLPRRNDAYAAFTVPVAYKGLTVTDRRFVEGAARLAKPVHVWTVNERSEAERLRALDVSGIITDFPDRMRGL